MRSNVFIHKYLYINSYFMVQVRFLLFMTHVKYFPWSIKSLLTSCNLNKSGSLTSFFFMVLVYGNTFYSQKGKSWNDPLWYFLLVYFWFHLFVIKSGRYLLNLLIDIVRKLKTPWLILSLPKIWHLEITLIEIFQSVKFRGIRFSLCLFVCICISLIILRIKIFIGRCNMSFVE